MKRDLNHFVFSGIMASHAAKDLERDGELRSPATTNDEREDQDLFASVQRRIRAASTEMQRAFRVLFVMENIVRDLIDQTFREADKTDAWFDTRATAEMKRKLSKRQDAETKNQWHVGRNREPIYFMDFGDLAKLIINNWDLFATLPGQSWVQSRLDEAEKSRNVIAHTNVLSSEEVTRLRMYLRDWIKQIG